MHQNPHEYHQVRLQGEQVPKQNVENGEGKTFDETKDNGNCESLDSFDRKRGKLKQKKLPFEHL